MLRSTVPNPDSGTANPVESWRPFSSASFSCESRYLDPERGEVRLAYRLDGMALVEVFRLPWSGRVSPARAQAVEAALDLLHWTAAISYWKAGCPAHFHFGQRSPDRWQADWLRRLYLEGLGEFAWRNGLDLEARVSIVGAGPAAPSAPRLGLSQQRALVPLGGGKDSLVALERARRLDGMEVETVQVGQAALICQVATATGCRHWIVERKLDRRLNLLNRAGAWNGHVPVTAINAAALVVAALVGDFAYVVFANERSADEATLIDPAGHPVNHQFSKSFAFECMLDDWVRRYIATDLRVFSLLRRDRELGVCRAFAALDRYHGVFSSCNRNFHLDGAATPRWCGQCPKCHFVALAMAPFLAPEALAQMFGCNLLDAPDQVSGFRALLALDGVKPFECVGEAQEARAALMRLSRDPRWSQMTVVRALAPLVDDDATPPLEVLCQPGGPDRIPEAFRASAADT